MLIPLHKYVNMSVNMFMLFVHLASEQQQVIITKERESN